MTDLSRRAAITTTAAGALAACLPAAASAVQLRMGPNDRRLIELERQWHHQERRRSRMAKIADRRYDADPEDSPLAAAYEDAVRIQEGAFEEMLALPADSATGIEAKFRVYEVLAQPAPWDGADIGYFSDRAIASARHDVGRLAGRV